MYARLPLAATANWTTDCPVTATLVATVTGCVASRVPRRSSGAACITPLLRIHTRIPWVTRASTTGVPRSGVSVPFLRSTRTTGPVALPSGVRTVSAVCPSGRTCSRRSCRARVRVTSESPTTCPRSAPSLYQSEPSGANAETSVPGIPAATSSADPPARGTRRTCRVTPCVPTT